MRALGDFRPVVGGGPGRLRRGSWGLGLGADAWLSLIPRARMAGWLSTGPGCLRAPLPPGLEKRDP